MLRISQQVLRRKVAGRINNMKLTLTTEDMNGKKILEIDSIPDINLNNLFKLIANEVNTNKIKQQPKFSLPKCIYPSSTPIMEIKEFSPALRTILNEHGITTLKDLRTKDIKEYKYMKSIGKKKLEQIEAFYYHK